MTNRRAMTTGLLMTGLAILAPAAMAQDTLGQEEMTAMLIGRWEMPVAETQAPGDDAVSAYVRQVVIFTEATQELRVEAFADEALTQPIFAYSSIGPYTLVAQSPVVAGAYDAELTNDRADMTIYVDTPDLWAALNMANCPLAINEAVDVRTCTSGPPFQVGDCIDLDLIHVDPMGTELRFGAPTTDRCVERPSTLNDVSFVKKG